MSFDECSYEQGYEAGSRNYEAAITALETTVVIQQAQIEQLKAALETAVDMTHNTTLREKWWGLLATPDDFSALRAHDVALTRRHIEVCKNLAAENEGLAGEVWCERCAEAIEKDGE